MIPAQALTRTLIALLKVILNQLADFNAQIADLFETLPDAPLFADPISLPVCWWHLGQNETDLLRLKPS